MKFGDKEWMDAIEKNYTFPVVLAMHLVSHIEKPYIVSNKVNTKAHNVGDVKVSKVMVPFDAEKGEKVALLGIRRIFSVEQYRDWCAQLRKTWKLED